MWRACVVLVFALGCGGGSSTAGACEGLALADCRVTPGCKPDLCDACFCDIAYRGCLGVTQIPDDCPALGCPTGLCCAGDVQCAGQGSCIPPGVDAPGCGACNADPGDCEDDTACAEGSICEPIRCSCDGNKACTPGCVDDADCAGEATVCDPTSHRCVARTCADDPECPSDFRCGAGRCARLACTDDLDCDGFCVAGNCYGSGLGTCVPPAP
jgi:hypothetical protein